MKKLLSVAALLSSFTTIFCCFLPALFVTFGAGASFAGLMGAFPQLTLLSEHKGLVFLIAGVFIAVSAFLQFRSRNQACPIDPRLAEGCKTARSWSKYIFAAALFLYALGFFFAFILPQLVG